MSHDSQVFLTNEIHNLPREVLTSIFSLAGPGPNAISLGVACRSWRSDAEEFLYRSISVFDKSTDKSTEFSCTSAMEYYYLLNEGKPKGWGLH